MTFCKPCFPDRHGKGSDDGVLLLSREVFKEVIVFDPNGYHVLCPAMPCPSLLLVCALLNCLLTGNLSSNTVSHEVILLGSCWILKWDGTCNGQRDLMMLVSSSSLLSLLQERASTTLFWDPLNPWLYGLSPNNMKRVACIQEASILTEAWAGLLPSSVKLDFLSHPSAVVLLVIKRTQSCWWRRPARMSTHGETIAARCSSRLLDAWKNKFLGRYHLHAQLLWLYPPKPWGQESEW